MIPCMENSSLFARAALDSYERFEKDPTAWAKERGYLDASVEKLQPEIARGLMLGYLLVTLERIAGTARVHHAPAPGFDSQSAQVVPPGRG